MVAKKIVLFLITCFLTGLVFGQLENKYKDVISDAEYHFLNEEYAQALKKFLEAQEAMPDNANLNYRIGLCYLNLPYDNGRSIKYLEKAVTDITNDYKEGSYKETQAPLASLFYLGYSYHRNNLVDKALTYYNKYRDTVSLKDIYNIKMVERQIISAENAREIMGKPVNHEINNLGHAINSQDAEYNPAVSADGNILIYTKNRPRLQKDSSKIYMTDIYRKIMYTEFIDGKWTEPRDITPELDTKGKCVTLSLSADGKTLLLYKDDWKDGGLIDFKAGTIYISSFNIETAKWDPIEKFGPSINSLNWETHACISPDGKKIYFTSDRKGGYGGLDIYVAEIEEDGFVGEAVNLGPTINTPYDEETPYILSDTTTLYFSSEGHYNMGGFDVFYSKLQENGEWTKPINVGYPISTTHDNLFYVPIKDGSSAFYSVERHEGYITFGDQDIYRIDLFEDEPEEKTDTTVIDSVLVEIQDTIKIEEKPKIPEKYFVIRNIYFDFNSAKLNRNAKIEAEKLFVIMEENPGLYIEVIGHSDSKGDSKYNKDLSMKRAQAVTKYLVDRGIEQMRFVSSGAGEEDLIASETSEEGQKLNRRVEIRVVKTDSNMVVTQEEQIPEELRFKGYNRFSIVLSEVESKVVKSKFTIFGDSIPILTMVTDKGFLYYFGNFKSKAEASKSLNFAISNGFENAYIIDYFSLNKKNSFIKKNSANVKIKYTIQLKASDKKVLLDATLNGVKEVKTKDGYYRYTYKEFDNRQDAEKELKNIIGKGFPNAFIIETYRLK